MDPRPIRLPLLLVIAGRPLPSPDEQGVRRAVDEYNRGSGRRREDLPDALNPRCLSADEALALLRSVPRLPEATREALAGATLELTTPGLKLSPVDGFGVNGFAGAFDLVPTAAGWAVSPPFDPHDVAADLTSLLDLVARRRAGVADLRARLASSRRGAAARTACARDEESARQALAAALDVALPLIAQARRLADLTGRGLTNGRHWDSKDLARLERDLTETLEERTG